VILRGCLIKNQYQTVPENLLHIKQYHLQSHLCTSYHIFPSNFESCYISKYPQNLTLLSIASSVLPADSVCCYFMLSFCWFLSNYCGIVKVVLCNTFFVLMLMRSARHISDQHEWEEKTLARQLSVKREIRSKLYILPATATKGISPLSNLHTNKHKLRLNFTSSYGLWISISTLHVVSEWVIERVNKQRNNNAVGIMATNLHGIVSVRLQTNIS
jgi:hypothetical protein